METDLEFFIKNGNEIEIMSKQIYLRLLLIVVVMIMSFSCTGTRKQTAQKAEDFVWPLPPAPAKIRFQKSVHSEMDLGSRNISFAQRIFESIFGRPRLKALKKPLDVHVDKNGRMMVVDSHWRKVLVFDFAGRQLNILGESGRGKLLNPLGVATDDDGKIYVTDADGHRIIIYDSDGGFLSAIGGKDIFTRPVGIAVNSKLGMIYVVDTWAHQIKVFDKETMNPLFAFGKKGQKPEKVIEGSLDQTWNRSSEKGEFSFPTNIVIGSDGLVYIVDTMNFRVQIFDSKGNYISDFGKIGNTPGSFSRPKGIGLDSEGHIYVTDAAFNNVQIFTRDGELLLFFGSFGSGLTDLRLPAGLYIDGKDQIYVVDQLNHRVQVYQYLSNEGL